MTEQITIRPGVAEDGAFLFATWLRGLYHGNDWFGLIDKDAYFAYYHIVISKILDKSEVLVACLADEPDVVLGYAVYRDHVLHWVHVKKAWRKMGIAKMLVPKDVTTCTHLTKVGKSLKPKEWTFNPFIL